MGSPLGISGSAWCVAMLAVGCMQVDMLTNTSLTLIIATAWSWDRTEFGTMLETILYTGWFRIQRMGNWLSKSRGWREESKDGWRGLLLTMMKKWTVSSLNTPTYLHHN